MDGGRPWHDVQPTCVVLVQPIVAPEPLFTPPENLPWQYVDAQVAAVALVRVYVGVTPPVRATVPNAISASPFPSMCPGSVTTLVVRAGWHSVQAIGFAMVVVACDSWTPTLTFVVTVRPRMSTGGLCRPVVVLPWQKVQFVAQVAKPAAAWQVVHDGPDAPSRSAPWQLLQPASPWRFAS